MLGDLPLTHDERVLVDYRTSDDAGVYRLDANRALVQTIDFFTPIVDDPLTYGRIAAANALSDVYAMGGHPLTALAVACFPKDADPAVLSTIFRGGLEKLQEAGVALLGGHTIQDPEIKFGYAVSGEIDPARVLSNAGARAGDVLILTKPIGTGVIATTLRFDRAPTEALDAAVASMTTVAGVHACTDITGFGLIGHGSELARASGATLAIDVDAVPLLPGVLDLVERNTPGGGRTNQEHFSAGVAVGERVDPRRVQMLYDPQTSGGLLIAVAADKASDLQAALQARHAHGWLIGSVAAAQGVAVRLR